ncbi:MAG: PIN domain-containing protein [Candidatus Bathyarchaeia archaeon]
MLLALDTTFFVLHYFSREENILSRTKRVLHVCRKLGNKGIVPTIVLGEFYALVHKRSGKDLAEKHFNEIVKSDLSIVELSTEISRQAGILRRKYEEKIPWGDCIIAATGLMKKVEFIITEDPHFERIKEIKARKLEEIRI